MTASVLILEDNPVARSFLRRVVRESFSNTSDLCEASDLDTARRYLARPDPGAPEDASPREFRLILIDLELPDGNVLGFLSELVGHAALKVVTTLNSDDDHLFPALERGAHGYLLKEDRFEVQVEELQKIVRGHSPLSPGIARRLLTHFRRDAGPHEQALSPPEGEVLTYLSKGFSAKEIANLMGLTWPAVSEHVKSIYRKFAPSRRDGASTTAHG